MNDMESTPADHSDLEAALANSAAGHVTDLGDFTQYADDDTGEAPRFCGKAWTEWNPDGTPLDAGYCDGRVNARIGRCEKCGASDAQNDTEASR